jgi:hypothetical protein
MPPGGFDPVLSSHVNQILFVVIIPVWMYFGAAFQMIIRLMSTDLSQIGMQLYK